MRSIKSTYKTSGEDTMVLSRNMTKWADSAMAVTGKAVVVCDKQGNLNILWKKS